MEARVPTPLFGAACLCVALSGLFPATSLTAGGEKTAGSKDAVLINIYDHMTGSASRGATPDWGYSAFIQHRGKTILFDGGTSPVILEHNAKALGVDLTEVDVIVISHGHGDHTAGINHVVAINPDVAIYVPFDWGFVMGGGDADSELRKGHRWLVDEYHPVKESTEIADGVHLISTASPHTGLYWGYPPHEEKPMKSPLKELSLALTTDSGDVVLVVGCSHSEVNRIVTATKETLDADIALVTGGFHLGPYGEDYVKKIALSMKTDLGVKKVAPTHCTGDEAIEFFKEAFGENALWAGLGAKITFPE